MKGIILAGGQGTRLYPLTLATSKQLLPVYDKPLIYYPLSVLMQAHIRDVLIISTPEDLPRFQALFHDGSHLGLSITYAIQHQPRGIAEAFLIGASFIGNDSVALVLGDNIFYGHSLSDLLISCNHLEKGGIVFGYEVNDPQRYGVVAFDQQMRVLQIIEKPQNPPSSFAVTGLYFYDNDVISIARTLRPSQRGELEITDLSNAYLAQGNLHLRLLDQGFAWLDAGTPDSLQKASAFVHTIQERQGIKIACIEEIALRQGFITTDQFESLITPIAKTTYGHYLQKCLAKSF
jgi:glucose-1-phosphate thymidylyltransferase